MLCMPIKYGDNDTIAIVQMINKTQEASSTADTESNEINGFDMKDIRVRRLDIGLLLYNNN